MPTDVINVFNLIRITRQLILIIYGTRNTSKIRNKQSITLEFTFFAQVNKKEF